MLIGRDSSCLLVVDIQEKLLPAMQDPMVVVRNTGILMQAAGAIGGVLVVKKGFIVGVQLSGFAGGAQRVIQGALQIAAVQIMVCQILHMRFKRLTGIKAFQPFRQAPYRQGQPPLSATTR